jgi:branched-chain amino acid transport system ATP-binding protein
MRSSRLIPSLTMGQDVERARSQDLRIMLEIENVTAGYADLRVLHGISLRVPEGRIEAVLGRNGVGKTTLLSVVSGELMTWTGNVTLGGTTMTSRPAYKRVKGGLAYVPEGKRIFRRQTVRENVALGTFALRLSRAERRESCERALEQFPPLAPHIDKIAGGLSGGLQQMVALAQALASNPRVLLLDEPSAGLAPLVVDELFARIRQLSDNGLTVVLVEQLADRALDIADHVTFLDKGLVSVQGAPATFRDGTALQEAYFGLTSGADAKD